MTNSRDDVIRLIEDAPPNAPASAKRNKCATCPHARAATAIIDNVVACPVLTALRAREVYDVIPADVEVLRGTGYPSLTGGTAEIPRGSLYVQDMVVLPRDTGACALDLDSTKLRKSYERFARSPWQFGAANEWIKTADRLPTTLPLVQVKVLFTAPGWGCMVEGMYQHHEEPTERWCVREGNHQVVFHGPRPTLWTPLPDLPSPSDARRIVEAAE